MDGCKRAARKVTKAETKGGKEKEKGLKPKEVVKVAKVLADYMNLT